MTTAARLAAESDARRAPMGSLAGRRVGKAERMVDEETGGVSGG